MSTPTRANSPSRPNLMRVSWCVPQTCMRVRSRLIFSSLSMIFLDISLSLSLSIRDHHPDVPDHALPALDDLGGPFALGAFEDRERPCAERPPRATYLPVNPQAQTILPLMCLMVRTEPSRIVPLDSTS